MIEWGDTPVGTPATLYLPGVRAAEVLAMAARRFNMQTLEQVDDHTLRCKTAGVTYMPIPTGGGLDLAGLITLDLPRTVRTGESFHIILRQVVDAPAPAPRPAPQVNAPAIAARNRRGTRAVVEPPPQRSSRHILGAFQLSILVTTPRDMLPRDERTLIALKRVLATVPIENRWYPVLQRYLSQLTARIGALGGPTDDGHHRPPHPEGDGDHEKRERRTHYEGKIAGLCFDRFGDFEGFWLDTEDGKRRFLSREANVERLVHQAWADRIAILVTVESEESAEHHELREVVLLRPPVGPSRG
jgi:hypothetical protein